MSQHINHAPSVRSGLTRRAMLWLVGVLVAIALAIAIVLIASNGSDEGTASATPASQSVGGPNEANRGLAAATAAGATPVITGGPNETLRGQSVAGATR